MPVFTQDLIFDPDLLRKYDRPLPRYTSYPPATELKPEFDPANWQVAVALGNYQRTPLSLYCHIPFCETACYFCGCNTVITKLKSMAERYLASLTLQIEQLAGLVNRERRVRQLHWGGGTPNYLSLPQVHKLLQSLREHFTFDPAAELSIEVNPRYLNRDYVLGLRQMGFNRISFGIQDFNPTVQAAINRVQPESMLFEVMAWMREAAFESINVDLIYGLPHQTLASFRETIHKTMQLDPDRIAVFNFAYVPWLKPLQKRICPTTLPPSATKLKMLRMTITELTRDKYVFIGMDHFAKPQDELAVAQGQGTLHRNFQGYTTQPESDLLGFGVTAISMLQDVYTQNYKCLPDFYRALEAPTLALESGVKLGPDDLVRRAVIKELMCQFRVSKDVLQAKYHLDLFEEFDQYFAPERPRLEALAADGLVHLETNQLQVTPLGRLLIRNVAAVFDAYLGSRQAPGFSRAV